MEVGLFALGDQAGEGQPLQAGEAEVGVVVGAGQVGQVDELPVFEGADGRLDQLPGAGVARGRGQDDLLGSLLDDGGEAGEGRQFFVG